MAVLKLATIIEPIWRTTENSPRGQHTDLPPSHTDVRPPAPPAIRPCYNQVGYSLRSTEPGADLVRQAIRFRALYGMWNNTNVAVFRYVITGPDGVPVERTLIATSGNMSHSEGRALDYLSALQASLGPGFSIRVTSVYSEREPCDGREGGQYCAALLAAHPLMQGEPAPELFASFPWSASSPAEGEEVTAIPGERMHNNAMLVTQGDPNLDLQDIEDEARREDVTHVLPNVANLPFVDALPPQDGRPLKSAAFSSREVAELPQSERHRRGGS